MSEAQDNPVEKTPVVKSQLPPKFRDPDRVAKWLPPKFKGASVHWSDGSVEGGAGKIRFPDGQGGFVEVDPTIVHVMADGKKVPVRLADRHTQWRQRAIFNLIAMLICLAILYLGFLLIVPRN
ncbi:MAG: hypothetical protein KF851_14540 [Pirellulaceae bacterium]|nr:hypothetical protein [Pirellulaceae bacterium]